MSFQIVEHIFNLGWPLKVKGFIRSNPKNFDVEYLENGTI